MVRQVKHFLIAGAALIAALAGVTSEANAAAAWVKVTPTTVVKTGAGSVTVDNYYTTLVSGTNLTSDNLLLPVNSCLTIMHKVTSFTGSATTDSLTLTGFLTSPTAPGWGNPISASLVAAQLTTTGGALIPISGTVRAIRAAVTGMAGSSQTLTVGVNVIDGCSSPR